MDENSIKILIIGQHQIIDKTLKWFLDQKEQIEVVGIVDYSNALSAVKNTHPDITLIDITTQHQQEIIPFIGDILDHTYTQIIVLANCIQDSCLIPIIKMGVLGCLTRESDPKELLDAIFDINKGGAHIPPIISRKLLEKIPGNIIHKNDYEDMLSSQQIKVLKLIGQGYTNQEVAEILVLSKRTVEMHTYKIFKRLNVSNRTQAVNMAIRLGYLNIEEINSYSPHPSIQKIKVETSKEKG